MLGISVKSIGIFLQNYVLDQKVVQLELCDNYLVYIIIYVITMMVKENIDASINFQFHLEWTSMGHSFDNRSLIANEN